jgi:multicomponent Na+:H+ antiporter subunit C
VEGFVYVLFIVVLAVNALLSIYGIVYRRSLIKKLISLTILSDTVFVSIILVGFIFKYPVVPPVYSGVDGEEAYLLEHASDPLPQALVLTGIVIGLAVNALIAFGVIQVYRLTGTTDAKRAIRVLVEEVMEE